MTPEPSHSFARLARDVLAAVGGAGNVNHHTHCMTRLRITLVRPEVVDHAALSRLAGVLGVVDANPLQVVVGPGAVKQVGSAFAAALSLPQAPTVAPAAASTRPARRGHPAVRAALRRIASICTPLIPALIGAGLVKAAAGLLQLWSAHAPAGAAQPLASAASVATLIGSAFFAFLVV